MPSTPTDRAEPGARITSPELPALLARLFGAATGAGSNEADLARLRQTLSGADVETGRSAIRAYLTENTVTVSAAIRLLDREVVNGYTEAGLALVNSFCDHFSNEERFVDFRLRFYLALGRADQLIAEIARVVGLGLPSVQLAYRVVLSLIRAPRADQVIDQDLHLRAIQIFLEAAERAPDKDLWLARYYRQIGNTIVGMRHYRAAWEALPESKRNKSVRCARPRKSPCRVINGGGTRKFCLPRAGRKLRAADRERPRPSTRRSTMSARGTPWTPMRIFQGLRFTHIFTQ